MANQSKGKTFMVGAVVGGVLGAVSALLFAPKSGRELRADIAETSRTVADKTQEFAVSVGEKTQEAAKAVGHQTSEWYGRAVELAGSLADGVKSWKEGRRDLPELAQTAGEQTTAAEEQLAEIKS